MARELGMLVYVLFKIKVNRVICFPILHCHSNECYIFSYGETSSYLNIYLLVDHQFDTAKQLWNPIFSTAESNALDSL